MNQLIWNKKIWIKRCISSIKDIKKLTLPIRNNAQLKETPHNFSLFVRKRRLMSNSRNQTHRQAKKFLFSFIALEPTCNTGNLRVESLRVNNNFFLTESAGSIGEYWLREVAVRIVAQRGPCKNDRESMFLGKARANKNSKWFVKWHSYPSCLFYI